LCIVLLKIGLPTTHDLLLLPDQSLKSKTHLKHVTPRNTKQQHDGTQRSFTFRGSLLSRIPRADMP